MIEVGMSEWVAKYGLACHCAVVIMILDFCTWLKPSGRSFTEMLGHSQ